jgi:hypothetical protein
MTSNSSLIDHLQAMPALEDKYTKFASLEMKIKTNSVCSAKEKPKEKDYQLYAEPPNEADLVFPSQPNHDNESGMESFMRWARGLVAQFTGKRILEAYSICVQNYLDISIVYSNILTQKMPQNKSKITLQFILWHC